MKQHWKINLRLEYGHQRYLILNTVQANSRAEAIETAVSVGLIGKYGNAPDITEYILIGDERMPSAFEFTADGWNYDTYHLDGYIISEADLHEAVRPVSEAEFMRLIGATPLPFGE